MTHSRSLALQTPDGKYVAAAGDEDGKFLVVSSAAAASATLYAGTLAATTSAAALASSQAVKEVLIQNPPDAAANILIGNASAQPIVLEPGDAATIEVANLATVYVKTASGSITVNYLGRS
jgi:hypothetical protein